MNTKTLIAIIGGIVVLGGAFFFLQNPEGGRMMNQKTSLKALLAIDSPQVCTFRDKTDIAENSGTVYVMRGRMRGDFESVAPGKTEKSHMVVDGDTSYIWTDTMPQGMMMNFADFDKPENKQEGTTDVNKEVDYSCAAWSPDESVFQRPGNVEFIDIQTMMQGAGGGMMQGGMMDKQPDAMQGGGTDIKAMQCRACDGLGSAEKAQCKAALGC